MFFSAARNWIRRCSLLIYRVLTWGVLAAGFLFAATILVLRYWILPDIAVYKDDIARKISSAAQQPITIGGITANWDGLRPQLALTQVVVHDAAGRPALSLPRVNATLSWRSAALLRVDFHALEIAQPVLNVRRDARGGITVAGMAMNLDAPDSGGFSRWVLGQRDISIRDARLVWSDAMRDAPELALDRLQLRIVNSGKRHRMALQALPPAALASPLDIRADLTGEDFQSLTETLTGQVFVQVDQVDIAAWRRWIDFPVPFPQGSGALRAWFTFDRNALRGVVADAQLLKVRARLGADLPELDMLQFGGRFSWKQLQDGFEVTTRRLTFTTGDHLTLPPVDLTLRLGGHSAEGYARGELQANALELVPLVQLADRLPLGNFRKTLTDHAPGGGVYELDVRWTGYWPQPATYAVRGRFSDLSLGKAGGIPGFSGFSGNIDGSEKGGTLHINTRKASLDMPELFQERLNFDAFTGQLAWSRAAGRTELRFNNLAYANPDLAGTLFGTYRTAPDGPGDIDLTGHLTRISGTRAVAYLPLTVVQSSRPWLERAFLAGRSDDVKFRVKGDLKDFPFAGDRGGIFEATAKVSGVAMQYGEGWPQIAGMDADLLFRGKSMDIHVRQGSIFGLQLSKVRAQIPDLLAAREVLEVSGEAAGNTAQFLDFIAQSPVRAMTDNFTEGMRAEGAGRLGLKLTLPLQDLAATKVSGTYQFINNQLTVDPALPPLEQVNGRVEFSESSARVPGLTATFLGGPLSVTAGSQRDATVSIQFQGRVNADAVRRAGGVEWMRHMRGVTDWRGALTVRRKRVDIVVDSTLQGLAVNLPAPLMKTAGEILPLRLERRYAGQQERIALTAGSRVSVVAYRRGDDSGNAGIERAAVHLGEGAAPEPQLPGMALTGATRSLDLDEWLAVMGSGSGGSSGNPVPGFSAIDLQVGELELFDRRFAEVKVKAVQKSGALQANVQGRDIDGSLSWQAQGKGSLTARLRRLALPAKEVHPPVPGVVPVAAQAAPELPALDVIVEDFQSAGHSLGRLELLAIPQQPDWRIEKLRLTSPEGALNVDGVWQSWLTQPATRVNVRLEVSDVGKFLVRWGYPEGVRRGTAKLEGALTWSGGPQRIDYPTLSGNFMLEAGKGQFVKLEPGIGKLLGVLSLQSLSRRLSLDFRDLFSEGLAFDEITGAIQIANGMATTNNLRIIGPSARISMSGQMDMARETQALHVKVQPQLSDSVSLAGALLGGPIAGAAAFVAQKLLKDPLEKIIAYEFDVTGTWTEPVVVREEQPKFESDRSGSPP